MPEDKVPVLLTRNLYEKIKKYIKVSQSEFRSVEEFIEFVLGRIISEEKEENRTVYSSEEESEIKERLRRLGYL